MIFKKIGYREVAGQCSKSAAFDRLIIATAQVNAAILVSQDANIQLYPDATVVFYCAARNAAPMSPTRGLTMT